MTISSESPHLAKTLKTLLPGHDALALDAAFDFSIQHGGRTELDFFRQPDVSYNPRPARIGLILLNDAGIRSTGLIAAGFLATVPAALSEAATVFPEPIWARAVKAQLDPAELLAGLAETTPPPEEIIYEASVLAVVLQLDRARHLHLGKPDPTAWTKFLEQTAQYVRLSRRCSPPIAVLLEAWTTKFNRRVATMDRRSC